MNARNEQVTCKKIVALVFFVLLGMVVPGLGDGTAVASGEMRGEIFRPSMKSFDSTALFTRMNLGSLMPPDLADNIEAIAVDDSGAIYAVGKTRAPGFPLVNPLQATYGGGDTDGFITVFAPDGQSLLFSSYIGGNDMDIITDVAVSDSGQVVLVGATGSTDFPLENPQQSSIAGFVDGFVMVFEPDLPNLKYSTFIGGDQWDYPTSMTVAPDGSVHLAGYTDSSSFPVVNPIQTYQGGYDVFVTGIAPDGQALIYSTHLGGLENDYVFDMTLDSNGRKYFVGTTFSADFPTINAYQPIYGGFWDAFVTVLSVDGQSLDMSTFLGGGLSDGAAAVQVDNNKRIFVGGGTGSDDFPLINPHQPALNGIGDVFLTIFNTDWQSLSYSTYFGGNQNEAIRDINVDSMGRFIAIGYTYSTDFPLVNPLQSNIYGLTDAFVSYFEQDGQSLLYSTYLGGDEGEIGESIYLNENDLVYIGGSTWSANFPVENPYQPEITGYVDGFVSIINTDGQSLQYSTYLGGFYPETTDVALNNLTGVNSKETGLVPAWVWLVFGLFAFFFASILIGRSVERRKL